MTESEALEIFTMAESMKEKIPHLIPAYKVAVKAIKEVQQYREIGTVEEFKELKAKPEQSIQKIEIQLEEFREEAEQFGVSGMLTDIIEVVKGGCIA